MTRNTYPDFELVPPGLRGTALQQIQRLEAQLGIPIPRDRVLSAPWVGRVYDRHGEVSSYGTSQGLLRNERRFWAAFRLHFPVDYGLIDPGRRLSSGLAQRYGWPGGLVGGKLIHHHMENNSLTVALPEALHQRLHGAIHQRPTVVASP